MGTGGNREMQPKRGWLRDKLDCDTNLSLTGRTDLSKNCAAVDNVSARSWGHFSQMRGGHDMSANSVGLSRKRCVPNLERR
jgi:hypothetical protein